jgi:DNA-binding Lrp family transcriptional regulator
MKSRTIKIAADSTFRFLQVFNGILELTDKELLILSKFVDNTKSGFCSAEAKRIVAKDIGILDPNTLNNYVKRLKDKGAIVKVGNQYKLAKLLKLTKKVIIEITT